MVRFQLRHGNDLLAMDSLRDCDVNVKEQGRLLRQNEFLVWEGRGGRKSLRQVFLFEELVLFSKARRFPDRKVNKIKLKIFFSFFHNRTYPCRISTFTYISIVLKRRILGSQHMSVTHRPNLRFGSVKGSLAIRGRFKVCRQTLKMHGQKKFQNFCGHKPNEIEVNY